MARIKTLVSVVQYKEENGNIVPDKEGLYYLLHWGLQTQIVYDANGNPVPVTNTVGICQERETGEIFLFPPQQIKVVGIVKNG